MNGYIEPIYYDAREPQPVAVVAVCVGCVCVCEGCKLHVKAEQSSVFTLSKVARKTYEC